QGGDKSAYISTNIISITVGKILLQSDLFFSGVRSTIKAGLSLDHVGSGTQSIATKKVAATPHLGRVGFGEVEALEPFGSDMDKATQAKLNRGERTVEVLKQGLHEPLPAEKQVMILFALTRGLLDDIAVEDVVRFESEFHVWIDTNGQEVLNTIRETG